MAKLPPDINSYLEQIGDGYPVTANGLENLINKVVIHTGIKYEISEIIIKHYFQELRNAMLRGDIIYLNKIGKLYIRCPKNGTSKKTVVPVIKAFKNINKKIKYDE